MASITPWGFDFETLPIYGHIPPEPVSLALQAPGMAEPIFMAWGHRTGGNNCAKEDAVRALTDAYRSATVETPLLAFNAKFDFGVAQQHFGLDPLPWHLWHDPMFLLFLDDPHQKLLGLKPSAARLLGMAQDERDAVEAWVLEHKARLHAEFPEVTRTYGGVLPSRAGAFIGYAPADVVEPYAKGDVTRALELFKLLMPCIAERGMQEAYDRERKLLPILLRNEREGVRVDTAALARDLERVEAAQPLADTWIRTELGAPGLDLDADAEVAKALDAAGMVSEWTLTKTGRKSTSKKNLKFGHFKDVRVAQALAYRQKCATLMETFLRPWTRYAAAGNGWMRTTWNQVRQAKGAEDTGGTRTGRPSTDNPNFLNMPKAIKDSATAGFVMPEFIDGLIRLPSVRSYILPDEAGHLIGRRDFNQQELRVLAHFEDGALLESYLNNPRLDVHQYLADSIQSMLGLDVGRHACKTLMFGYIYGQGVPMLAQSLGKSVDEVKRVREAQLRVLPGLKGLSQALKERAARNEPLRTWGGREYYVEPPMWSEKAGRWLDFAYKLVNYLVQGSSADITKESIIRYDAIRKEGRFMLSVYDENDISCPRGAIEAEMLLLREAMMSIEVDVPLISDGEIGPTLGNLEDIVEPAPDLSRWAMEPMYAAA